MILYPACLANQTML